MTIKGVVKRSGEIVPYDRTKIEAAIDKAITAVKGKSNISRACELASKAEAKLRMLLSGVREHSIPAIEEIQDIVEDVLIDSGEKAVAKAYILYRSKRSAVRDTKALMLDINSTMDGYLGQSDWRVHENANVNYSLGGLILHNSGAMTANYWLNNVYSKEIAEAHKSCAFHLHDLSMFSGYCFTGDTRVLTPDGKNPTFKELVDSNVKELTVYTTVKHGDRYNIHLAKAVNPRITQCSVEYTSVEVIGGLNDRTWFTCTHDHLFRLSDGSYCEAKELRKGSCLMSIPCYGYGYWADVNKSYYVSCVLNGSFDAFSEMYDLTVPEYENFAIATDKNAGIFVHNCAGWSLRQLISEGLGGVEGKITSTPPSHLSTLVNQMVNFLGILQNEWAGAQAFSSFDTYCASFVKADSLTEKETKQCIQSFLYGVNTPSRWGSQAPFTNITLDWTCPQDLKDKKAIVGGKEMDFTYGECQKEMDTINRVFIELMLEGDANKRGFAYPIPTYNMTKDFDWESDNSKLLFEMASQYGTPYFQNFINSDLNPSDVRSMCCRLRLDKRELRKRGGGLFGSDEFTGSIGVVTINMPQIGFLHKGDKLAFYNRLDHLMDLARDSLITKRKVLSHLLESGLYPYTARYLKNFNNHFNTIGLCGMNECCLNFMGITIADAKGHDFAVEVLEHMRARLQDYQEATGELFNLEATPAEGTSYRLALHDKQNYPDIMTSGTRDPFYTNSTQLPVNGTADVFDALDAQESLQTLYTGGTVFHVFMGERIKDWKACRDLVKTIMTNYRVPYITISPTYSICPIHGYLEGEHFECPKCKAERITQLQKRLAELEAEKERLIGGKV